MAVVRALGGLVVALLLAACGKTHDGSPPRAGAETGSHAGDAGADTAGARADGSGGASAGGGASADGDASAGGSEASAGGDAGASNSGGARVTGPARLQAWELYQDGSAVLTVGIWDTERDLPCTFRRASDGVTRCLPASVDFSAEPDQYLIKHFADPSCTVPVYTLDRSFAGLPLPPGPWAVPLPTEDCDERFAVATLRELPLDAPLYGFESCERLSEMAAYSPSFVVDELSDPTEWVAAELEPGEPVVGRLSFEHAVTADGSRFPTRLVDERYGRGCSLFDNAHGAGCEPPALNIYAADDFYGDAQCRQRIWPVADCEPPVLIGGAESEMHFALGDPWTGGLFGTNCGAVLGSYWTSKHYVLRGALLGDDAIPSVTYKTTGEGRLRPRGLEADDGSFVAVPRDLAGAARFFDSELGEDCDPIWTPEGLVRCVPTSLLVRYERSQGYFDDPACSVPTYGCPSDTPCFDREVLFLQPKLRGGWEGVAIHRSVPVSGSYYWNTPEECSGSPVTFPTNYIEFKAGELLPWDRFPILEERHGSASAP